LWTPSEKQHVLAVWLNNVMKGKLESLKAELKTLEERLDKGIGDAHDDGGDDPVLTPFKEV
jgi:hypothetical protein